MVRVIEVFECEVCGNEYSTYEAAEECESRDKASEENFLPSGMIIATYEDEFMHLTRGSN